MNLRKDLPLYDIPELAAAWEKAHAVFAGLNELEVPAAMMVGTRRILFQTALLCARDVLDIGTHTGLSALTFALAGCNVTSLDKVDANGPQGRWVKFKRRKPRELMKAAGVAERVQFVAEDSLRFLARTKQKFDLICIDGCHRQSHVQKELPLAIRRLRPDGLIFMDDMQPPDYVPRPGWDRIPGPWNAVQHLIKSGLKVRVVPISQTLEGEKTATAFILAR
jgi:predicted O-methyltransferase YrrM